MRDYVGVLKSKRKIVSMLLVWMMAATFFVVFVPLQTPTVKGQIIHLASCAQEDMMGPPYDMDGIPNNNHVLWDLNQHHVINMDYQIEPWMTLEIPALNYTGSGDPGEIEITFAGSQRIDVLGELITNNDYDGFTRTAFIGSGFTGFNGIYVVPMGRARIDDCLFINSANGVVFDPNSILTFPGIRDSEWENPGAYGLRLNGATGYTNMASSFLDDRLPSVPTATLLEVKNAWLNVSNTNFLGHGPNIPAVHLDNATVRFDSGTFYNDAQPGNSIFMEGNCSGTVIDGYDFRDPATGNYYIESEGSSYFSDNCSFRTEALGYTALASDNSSGAPSHPVFLNPTADGIPGFWDNTFDNTTLHASGASSITLQWYKNVYVEDPASNPLVTVPVWIKDRLLNPAQPGSKLTNATGWAPWFRCTELIVYSGSTDNFNPFNISSTFDTMWGYVDPEEVLDQSKENIVVVPFNPIPNNPPTVPFLPTPGSPQSGLINIQFRLEDLDIVDDGNLSVNVEFWDPGLGWVKCTAHVTSDPTSNLYNDTLYTFVWDSSVDFPDQYSTQIKVRITPFDLSGPGTPSETLDFTVDNLAPHFLTLPTVVFSDTAAYINWTVDEPAEASILYGFDGIFTTVQVGNSGTTDQSVPLTGLQPGRNYTYYITSTDSEGNARSSNPDWYFFHTQVRIHLKTGWNMISLPPITPSSGAATVENIFAPIAGLYDAVQAYDSGDTNDPWKHYRPGKPWGNDLVDIGPNMGLWIHMTSDALLILDHKVPQMEPTPFDTVVPLERGWNYIGYPSVTNRATDIALLNVPWSIIWAYDEAIGQWDYYDGATGGVTQMERCEGYWIYVTSNYMWTVTYA